MMYIPEEAIALFPGDGVTILYNVFARTSLGLSKDAMTEVLRLSQGEAPGTGPFTVWMTGWFSNEKGLLEDPTRLLRNRDDWPDPLQLSGEGLAQLLCKQCLLVENREAYLARFAPKTGLLDFTRFGNFHQQLGQYLMTVLRVSPDQWWYGQKYLPDFSGMRDNPYKFIQEAFLKEFFAQTIVAGMRVLDVGCGVGYISRMMARAGAEVIGLDPNPRYVGLAEEGTGPGRVCFHQAAIGSQPMDMVADGWADAVFMSDALLFYFIPDGPKQRGDIDVLLGDIHRVLRPGGRFWSLEPHAAFFLAPRFGAPERPFTVLSEYRHKHFGITPDLSQTLGAMLSHGFALTAMRELAPTPSGTVEGDRDSLFAREFPQWQFLECVKMS